MSKKNILITGAGGRYCQILIPNLIKAGHNVLATDIAQLDYECPCMQLSVTDLDSLRNAMWRIDTVIHVAGIHYQQPRTTDRPDAYDLFYKINVTGTHNVLLAAQFANVKKVIFVSSVAYYENAPGFMDEDFPAAHVADHYYNMSKVLAENLCRYYAKHHDLNVIALRPGNFTGNPEPSIDFLDNRLRREDVAHLTELAVDYEPEEHFEAFNILAGNPFTKDDVEGLQNDPWSVLEKYYPGATKLLKDNGVEWNGIQRVPCIKRAREKLNYQPQYTFEAYLEKLKSNS